MAENAMQQRLTNMLSWFHRFCVEHGIRYYLLGGTMLGAVRHQGFIPWDDDIDVGVPRADYEKLMGLLREPRDGYIGECAKFHAGKVSCAYGKLYDTGTTLIERSKYNIRKGIYIDIFPLDGFGDTREDGLQHFKKIKFLENLLAIRVCTVRKGRSFLKNAAAVAGKLLPVNDQKLILKIDRLCAQRDFDLCRFVGNMMSTYREKEIMPKEIYGTPTFYTFEGLQVYGVENAEGFLTQVYGDWRKLPPEEKRVSLHKHVYINLNKSYLEEPH